jgi:hypothetical protein
MPLSPIKVFHGVLVQLTANISVLTGANTLVTGYTVVYDTDDFYNDTDPSRLTVPNNPNFTMCEAFSTVGFQTSSNNFRECSVAKNGAVVRFGRRTSRVRVPNGEDSQQMIRFMPEIVAMGDYFELYVYQNNGTTISLFAGETFFGLKIL